MSQLTAELNASIATDAAETATQQAGFAKSSANVARVALFVAIFTLVVGFVQMVLSFASRSPQLPREQLHQRMDACEKQVEAEDGRETPVDADAKQN